jgi:hypothetical protein
VGTSATTNETWTPVNAEERRLIQEELNQIVTSAPFRNSRRYPALLRYIVEETLANNSENLKERTIGIEVFGRPADYDTNSDPIVRFTAGEVRKRIALFYRDGNNHGSVEITVPVGSYIPQFRRRTTAEEALESNPPSAKDELLRENTRNESDRESKGVIAVPIKEPPPVQKKKVLSLSLHPLAAGLGIGIALTLLLVFSISHVRRNNQVRTPIMSVWQPLLKSPDMVLISAGRQHPKQEASEPPDMTMKQHIRLPEFQFSLTTVKAISNIVGFLQTQHKSFRIHEAYSNNLQDLHDRPVVLVTGNNNKWTLLLLQHLRFRFVENGDYSYIEDAKHPDKQNWSVNFNTPYSQQSTDYAIVARFYDPTTDGPVIVVAGISSNGTDAAGKFIVSPEALETLSHAAPDGSLERNFEAVLKVEVIGGNTGATTIVATHFW